MLISVLLFSPLFFTSSLAMSAVVVDINQADTATMIANWKGIGEKKAKAIVDYRKKNGPFSDINDLANVKGIGDGLIKNNKKYMSVKGGVKATQKSTSKSTATKSTATKSASSAKKSTTKKPKAAKTTAKKSTSKSSTKKSKSKKSKKPCTDKSKSADCKKKTK